jgi:hypothetical protein
MDQVRLRLGNCAGARPGHRALTFNRKVLYLLRGPVVAENDRYLVDAQLARGLQAEVSIHHLTVASREHRNFEAELTDAAAHAIDGGVVFPGITSLEDQLLDGPDLDLKSFCQGSLRSHASLLSLRNPPQGAPKTPSPTNGNSKTILHKNVSARSLHAAARIE